MIVLRPSSPMACLLVESKMNMLSGALVVRRLWVYSTMPQGVLTWKAGESAILGTLDGRVMKVTLIGLVIGIVYLAGHLVLSMQPIWSN
jgi:hypothetical protein